MSTYTSFDQDLILGQLVLRVLILLDTMENLCKILVHMNVMLLKVHPCIVLKRKYAVVGI